MNPFGEKDAAIHAQHLNNAAHHTRATPWAVRQLMLFEINIGHCYNASLTRAKAAAQKNVVEIMPDPFPVIATGM